MKHGSGLALINSTAHSPGNLCTFLRRCASTNTQKVVRYLKKMDRVQLQIFIGSGAHLSILMSIVAFIPYMVALARRKQVVNLKHLQKQRIKYCKCLSSV